MANPAVRSSPHSSLLRKGEAVVWLALAASAVFEGDQSREPSRWDRPRATIDPAPQPLESTRRFTRLARAGHIHAKELFFDIYARFANDRVMSVAAGVTYYAILSVFPALAATVSLYALVSDPTAIQRHLQAAAGIAPDAALQIVGDQLRSISNSGAAALGAGFLFSLAISLWSANAGVKALFDALNIVYDVRERRGFVKLNLASLAFTAAMVIFVAGAVFALVAIPAIVGSLGNGPRTIASVVFLRWPAMFIAAVIVIAALFQFGPSLAIRQRRRIVPGALFATTFWVAASAGFSWYAANFGSYNQTYGALGAVVITMTWLWISLNVVLVGAQINASLDRRYPLTLQETANAEA